MGFSGLEAFGCEQPEKQGIIIAKQIMIAIILLIIQYPFKIRFLPKSPPFFYKKNVAHPILFVWVVWGVIKIDSIS